MKLSAIEMVTVEDTAPGASGGTFNAATGDSLTIRGTAKKAHLLAAWTNFQSQGFLRLTSPRLHDTTSGIQISAPVGVAESEMPIVQELAPQDTLTAFGVGSATAGDIEQGSILVGYENLLGVAGRFITKSDLIRKAVELFTVRTTLAGAGTSGGYSGEEAINNDQDQFKANEDYAVLGASAIVDAGTVCSIGIRAPDWGNFRVGVPGSLTPVRYSNWFVRLSDRLNAACIPVFNSSNRGVTLVDVAKNEVDGDPEIVIWLARLK